MKRKSTATTVDDISYLRNTLFARCIDDIFSRVLFAFPMVFLDRGSIDEIAFWLPCVVLLRKISPLHKVFGLRNPEFSTIFIVQLAINVDLPRHSVLCAVSQPFPQCKYLWHPFSFEFDLTIETQKSNANRKRRNKTSKLFERNLTLL